MSKSVIEAMSERKSVRSYDDAVLPQEELAKLQRYIDGLSNPFGVPVELRILDGAEYGLSSPVLIGDHTYIAGKTPQTEDAELAYGYEFEKLVIFAESLGISTVWLAATLDRPAFEKALQVEPGEVMPAMTPIGHAAKRRSLREIAMRKAMSSDSRRPFGELFFDGSFTKPLIEGKGSPITLALEMVRLAPSAGNNQPWRVVIEKDANSNSVTAHFFEHHDEKLEKSPLGDIQLVDMGIALAHFEMACEELGLNVTFKKESISIQAPERIEYIISAILSAK